MTDVPAWLVVLILAPALFGIAIAAEHWRDHWRARQARRAAERGEGQPL